MYFNLFSFRSLWGRETELTAEIERLKSEVVKAEKSLDHATPGVSVTRAQHSFPFQAVVLVPRPFVLGQSLFGNDKLLGKGCGGYEILLVIGQCMLTPAMKSLNLLSYLLEVNGAASCAI